MKIGCAVKTTCLRLSRSSRANPWPRIFVVLVGVMLVASLGGVVAGCGSEDAMTTAGKPSTTTATAETTATSSPAQEIQVFRDVRFMSERTADRPPLLDVYAPKQAGPWPLVVMLPGGFERKDTYMSGWATKVAERGAVVFVPDWIRIHELPPTPEELRAALIGMIGDIGAAVRFARGTGGHYGGDPGNLTLFGHSGGAMGATMEAFSRAPASEGGLEGAGSTIPESLVVFDGDYLLGDSPWNEFLAEDPGLMQVYTPWQYLGERVDFPVTVIGSSDPNLSRELGDPWATDSWLALRDPSGDIRRGLEELGAFEGPRILNENTLELFVERLRADGDTVTYVRLTDSTHAVLGPQGMKSLLDALVPSER